MKITQELAEQIHAKVLEGQELAKKGNVSEAEAILQKASRLCPEHPDPHQILGLIYFQQKKYDLAKEHLGECLKAVPDQPFVQVSLAQTLMALGDNAGAFSAFSKAVKLAPDLGAAWVFLSDPTCQIHEYYCKLNPT